MAGNYGTTVDPVSRFFQDIPFSMVFAGEFVATRVWVQNIIDMLEIMGGGGGDDAYGWATVGDDTPDTCHQT